MWSCHYFPTTFGFINWLYLSERLRSSKENKIGNLGAGAHGSGKRSKTTGKKLNNTHITTYLNNNSFHNTKKHLLNRKCALETYEVYWLCFLTVKPGQAFPSLTN